MILEEFTVDGGVDGSLDSDFVFEKIVKDGSGDTASGEWVVKCLGSLVEDVAKETVVDDFFVGVVGLLKVADVTVEEAELTAQVSADGCGTDAATVFGETLAEDVKHSRGFVER